jgi:WD40 repeat protein
MPKVCLIAIFIFIIYSINLSVPIWSCGFSSARHQIFAGLATGLVCIYDLRSPKQPVHQYDICNQRKKLPIHSLSCHHGKVYASSFDGTSIIDLSDGVVSKFMDSPEQHGLFLYTSAAFAIVCSRYMYQFLYR